MKLLSATTYYLQSVVTLFKEVTNFWVIPLIFVKKPINIIICNGLEFQVRSLMDIWTLKEVVIDRHYEQFEKIGTGWTIVDIGAGVGDFSIMNDKKANKIIAYEKEETASTLMLQNLQTNRCQHTLLIRKPAQNLDKLFKENKILNCDLLKIDCEGYEYPILFNTSPHAYKRIKRIVMEYHLFNQEMVKSFPKLKTLLEKNGFLIKEAENPVHSNIGFLYAYKLITIP